MKIQDIVTKDFKNYKDLCKKFVKSTAEVSLYEVKYKYETKRKNSRINEKYVIAPTKRDAELIVEKDIEEMNEKYPYRALLNVDILSSKRIGNLKLEIQA